MNGIENGTERPEDTIRRYAQEVTRLRDVLARVPLVPRLRITFEYWGKPLADCAHGPKAWPRWKFFAVNRCRAGVSPPTLGWHFWFYTRGSEPGLNDGRVIAVVLDRRPRNQYGKFHVEGAK